MNCRRTQSYLSAYIDSELTGHEMLLVRNHVTYCDECSAHHQSLLSVKRLLSALPAREPRLEFAAELQSIKSTNWVDDFLTLLMPDRLFSGAAPLISFPANHRRIVSACALSVFSLWFIVAPTARAPRPEYTNMHRRHLAEAGFSPFAFVRWHQSALEPAALDVMDRPTPVQDSHLQWLQVNMLRANRAHRLNMMMRPYFDNTMMGQNTTVSGFGQPSIVYSGYSTPSR